MKNVLKIFVLAAVFSLVLTACNDDKEYGSLNVRYYNFGMVEAVNGDLDEGYYIRLDNGSRLVLSNASAVRNIEDEDRIVAVYTLLGELEPYEGDKRYLALLVDYAKVFNKPAVLQSFINGNPEIREDSIGFNPISVDKAWFGGRYLNIEFSVARQRNTNHVHFINLVADDIEMEDGVMNVYLRHNGYEDVPEPGARNFENSPSLVSFDMTALLPEGQSSLDIRLHWTQYSSTKWDTTVNGEKKGTFKPYGKTSEAPSVESVTLDNNYHNR